MNDQSTIFSPERNQWTLTDGRHHMEVPGWAREIMRDEFERETRPLRDNLDLALDSKRIAERRVTGLLAENAKLRELVRELWEGYNDPRCEECHLKDTPTCADCPICAREASVIDRMRELGVVVE